VGYSTKGVAHAPLNSLLPIYPSHTILQLALLKRKVSARTQRAGDPDVDTGELAFMVVIFKKINNNIYKRDYVSVTLLCHIYDLAMRKI
jgi:hypothetical protein